MADTHDFEGSTHHFGPPPGLEEMIGWLHVFHNGKCCVSAWKPSEAELIALNNGESIFISVMSGTRVIQLEDGTRVEVPCVLPAFVGIEANTKEVVSDTGKVW